MNSPRATPALRQSLAAAALALILAGFLVPAGCNAVGYVAGLAGGRGERKVKVPAAYRGLEGKAVAVLVAADEFTMPDHPGAPYTVSRAVSRTLALAIPGIRLVDPAQLTKFQEQNPYWKTLPYGQAVQRLGADRLVYVDLLDYQTHEPGNPYLGKGKVSANVGVASADAGNPDDLVFASTVEAVYPEGTSVGSVNAKPGTIEAGMIAAFAENVADLFRDHTRIEK